jgi:membrane-associated protein
MLGSLSVLGTTLAYPALFVIVGGESAGVPLPGETSLVAAAILASHGHLSLPLVVAVAAAGAIAGDNVGYALGRRGGRTVLSRPGWGAATRRHLLERGERFFERHGAKTVFLARWLPGLRIAGAWLAGTHGMPWRRFALWNAVGGVAWAVSIGTAAYLLGHAAARAFQVFGAAGAAGVAVSVVAVGSWRLLRRRRTNRRTCGSPRPSDHAAAT